MSLLLATRNEHKALELSRLLGASELELLPPDVELPPETAATFAENARTKASAAARATGRATIADDSGIEAQALGGQPGVRSARYARPGASDAENLDKLRREAPSGSALTYVCALAYSDPARGIDELFEGRCRGTMAAEPRGSGGFGYDPVFVVGEGPGEGRTMAELAGDEKDAISHRGRAARALAQWLRS